MSAPRDPLEMSFEPVSLTSGEAGRRLVIVGCNPPSTTTGLRTRNRALVVTQLLNFDEGELVNLSLVPTYRSGGLSDFADDLEGWRQARVALADAIQRADGVVLAFGVSEPSGPAREHFRDQVRWLARNLATRGVPVWWVGGAPRHPSRWHRYTSRAHPDLPFSAALPLALNTLDAGELDGLGSSTRATPMAAAPECD